LRGIFRKSLTLKITLVIFVIETILLCIMGTYYFQRFNDEIDKRVAEKMAIPAALMSELALNFEAVKDLSALEKIIQEKVVDAFIVKKDGRVFFSADPSRLGKSFTAFVDHSESLRVAEGITVDQIVQHASPAGESYLSVLSPIEINSTLLGFLYIKIRADEIQARKQHVILLFLLGSLITVLLTTVIEAFWVYHLFVPRIATTVDVLQSVENGEYSARIAEPGPKDQIGGLMRNVNTMIEQIENHAFSLQSLTRAGESLSSITDRGEVSAAVLGFLRDNLPVLSEREYRLPQEAGLDAAEIRTVRSGEILFKEDTLFVSSWKEKEETALSALVLDPRYRRFRKVNERFVRTLSRLMATTIRRLESQNQLADAENRRKVAEAEQRTTAKLLEALEEKNVELAQTLEELGETQRKLGQSEKMAAIGTMAGGVAHDLNNILSGIVGYPDLLLMRLPEKSEMRHGIEVIKESGARAADVVADLLTLARGVAYNTVIFDINHLVQKYLTSAEFDELSRRFPAVTVTSRLATHLGHTRCSPVHIQKVIMNLVTNAFEAINTKGKVSITTEDVTLGERHGTALQVAPGDYVALRVSDTGPGITADDLEHIFEPFYTKKVFGRSGTGLGLSVVWNTMREHKGAAAAESAVKGATFSIYLPAGAVGSSPPEEENLSIACLKGSGSVLVVDDEEMLREITADMLTTLGYSVSLAASGEEAVASLEDSKADLVLLDMLMPGMSGYETYREILKKNPGQKAVIISGYSETNDLEKARELGVGGFLKKPFTIEQLGRAVRSELGEDETRS
jgi:signal transduction histidine kinase/ActR/RegA family two-component response regulator